MVVVQKVSQGVTVRTSSPTVRVIKQFLQGITIRPSHIEVKMITQQPIQYVPVNKPFSLVSTQGQTIFPLNSAPRANGVLVVAINGIFQGHTDYSIVGNSIQFATGLDSGDIVSGIYEQA